VETDLVTETLSLYVFIFEPLERGKIQQLSGFKSDMAST
jgi:hypothetical protein